MVKPGDVIRSGGREVTVVTGPHRSSRVPGKVNFLVRRPDGRCFSVTVPDTDDLAVTHSVQ